MKLVSWNVNSLKVRLPQLLDFLATRQPDVVCLQETKLEDGKFPAVEIESAGYHAVYSGQKTYNGVAILARARPADPVMAIPGFADEQKRVLAATVGGVGRVNPVADIETINTELALADMESVDKALARAEKASKAGDKDAMRWRDSLKRMHDHLDQGRPIRALALDDFELQKLRELPLLTAKPVMYVANVLENGFRDNPHLDAVRALAATEGAEVVPVCAAIEAEIGQLDEADRTAFLADLGFDEPGLNRVIRAAYKLLGLQTFFTCGPKEVRAWTVHKGSTAPQAAGEIHTDFERGFIRAETIAYDDFVACKGETGARDAGKLRLEGKEYIVQEGDVMHFPFNV